MTCREMQKKESWEVENKTIWRRKRQIAEYNTTKATLMLTPVTSEVHGLFCQSRAAQAASDGQLTNTNWNDILIEEKLN